MVCALNAHIPEACWRSNSSPRSACGHREIQGHLGKPQLKKQTIDVQTSVRDVVQQVLQWTSKHQGVSLSNARVTALSLKTWPFRPNPGTWSQTPSVPLSPGPHKMPLKPPSSPRFPCAHAHCCRDAHKPSHPLPQSLSWGPGSGSPEPSQS